MGQAYKAATKWDRLIRQPLSVTGYKTATKWDRLPKQLNSTKWDMLLKKLT